jgi:hypothetical protein
LEFSASEVEDLLILWKPQLILKLRFDEGDRVVGINVYDKLTLAAIWYYVDLHFQGWIVQRSV